MKPAFLSIVIPVFNEHLILNELIERSLSSGEKAGYPFELILVDDASTDATSLTLQKFHGDPRIRSIRFKKNLGQFRATQEGIRHARGDWIAVLDGDLQDPPETVTDLVGMLESVTDPGTVIFAVKKARIEKIWFKISNGVYQTLLQWMAPALPHNAGSYCLMPYEISQIVAGLSLKSANLAAVLGALNVPAGSITYTKSRRYDNASRVRISGLAWEALSSLFIVSLFGRRQIAYAKTSHNLTRSREIYPKAIRLEATTACQLKCPLCPTGKEDIAKSIGVGFLKFQNFKHLVDKNPGVIKIELSNWGEMFLNTKLIDIIRYAYQKNVSLTANNGVNLNTASPEILEALVKYRFHSITCSIDGASPETYSIYRRGGDFQKVISNIKTINKYKEKYQRRCPRLIWQFIAFGYNEHEIEAAEKLAADLGMEFNLKLSSHDSFSPIKNKELVRKKSCWGVASRAEYRHKYNAEYLADHICAQLWTFPQINFDGKMLGCCNNYWGDYGNVFTDGLLQCLNNERIDHARAMVTGEKPRREDIPCSNCFVYHSREKHKLWLDPKILLLKRKEAKIQSGKTL